MEVLLLAMGSLIGGQVTWKRGLLGMGAAALVGFVALVLFFA